MGRLLTIAEVRAEVEARKSTAAEIVETCFGRIKQEDGEIGAFLTLSEQRARAQAERIDKMAAAGETLPPLAGVPVAM